MAALKRPANGDAAPQTKKVRFDRNVTEKKHSTAESGGKFSKPGTGGGRFNNTKPGGKFSKPGGKFNKPDGKFSKPGGKFIKPDGKFNKPDGGKKFAKGSNTIDQNDGNNENNGTAATNAKLPKPDWNKIRQDKKDLKVKRKSTNSMYNVASQAKEIYEKLKCKSTTNKAEHCRQLHGMLRNDNQYHKFVLAHDTARIVQCMLKHAPAEIKREISESLIQIFDQIAVKKYSHFCATRIIQYGTQDIRSKAIDAVFGNVIKLVTNQNGSAIIDTMYVSWASPQQKAYMRQEFYGDLYKKSKDSSVKCIADTYRDSGHMKLAVVNAVKSHLDHIVNKKFVDNGLVHSVLLDYLHECQEPDRLEIVTAYSPYIPSLASTKDGTRAAIICFWNSIVKDRRAIVKSLREHLVKICTHEHGHSLIIAIINTMDDTKALKKAIFDHIFTDIDTLITNEYGRRVIEWFVSPGNSTGFHPAYNALLEEGLKFSKKDKETRRAELLDAVEEPICTSIVANPFVWLRGGNTSTATAAILKSCRGEHLKKAFDSLASVVCSPEWKIPVKEVEDATAEAKPVVKSEDGAAVAVAAPLKIKKKRVFAGNEEEKTVTPVETVLGIEHAGLHLVLKKIIKSGKDNDIKFSTSLAEQLTKETVKTWLPLNRAAFIILCAYENANEETQQKLKALVADHLSLLKKQTHAASKLLLKNMQLK